MMKSLTALALFTTGALAGQKGVDVSNYNGVVSQNTYSNFAKQGYDFSIVQAWQENHANTNFQANYNNAVSAGMNHVDAYAFVCNTCHGGTTANQVVSSLKSTLPSNYQGTVWLDVEQCNGCWTSNGQENHQFVSSVASQLQSEGYNVGIYSNKNMWNEVMGSAQSNTGLSNLPLWYAHYDNTANFNDPNAYKFAGWTDPTFKQYAGDAKVDGQDVDLDYGSNVDNDVDGKSNADSDKSQANKSQDASKSGADKSQASKSDVSKSGASKSKSGASKSDASASKSQVSKSGSSADKSSSIEKSSSNVSKSGSQSSKISSVSKSESNSQSQSVSQSDSESKSLSSQDTESNQDSESSFNTSSQNGSENTESSDSDEVSSENDSESSYGSGEDYFRVF